MPANLVFRRKIWGARDNGIPPRSTPGKIFSKAAKTVRKCGKDLEVYTTN